MDTGKPHKRIRSTCKHCKQKQAIYAYYYQILELMTVVCYFPFSFPISNGKLINIGQP